MKRLVFSPKAQADLDGILDYIAHDKPRAARKFVSRLKEECRRVAGTPGVGTACDNLSPGLRAISYGSYVIFFRAEGRGTRVERVIHGARDMSHVFADDDF